MLVRKRTENQRRAGGASRDRTADLLIANEALSQLSYGPYRPDGTKNMPKALGSGAI